MSDMQSSAQRVRVEQGIYQQPNGKYAVCLMVEGKPRFSDCRLRPRRRRIERAAYIDATPWGIALAAPQLRLVDLSLERASPVDARIDTAGLGLRDWK